MTSTPEYSNQSVYTCSMKVGTTGWIDWLSVVSVASVVFDVDVLRRHWSNASSRSFIEMAFSFAKNFNWKHFCSWDSLWRWWLISALCPIVKLKKLKKISWGSLVEGDKGSYLPRTQWSNKLGYCSWWTVYLYSSITDNGACYVGFILTTSTY